MLKFYISYFYQVRNMKPNMLPVSTAMWDPKWFHEGNRVGYKFIDSNGVINGVNFRDLVMPGYRFESLIKNDKQCRPNCPYINESPNCAYLIEYGKFLREKHSDFEKFIKYCEDYIQFLNRKLSINLDTIIFLVHETPDRKCSERFVLRDWFEENGYELKEFNEHV